MSVDIPAIAAAARSPRGWWYGIGKSPTAADIEFAARHYDLVVLNAWETAAMRSLRELNPAITVLVYKDFSSTRSYLGAVEGDHDAPVLPTGVGYHAARRTWFALNLSGRRVEWSGYPKHWQMAVWDRDYQTAWAQAVTREVVTAGWDGVLADNDFNTLRYYYHGVLRGTLSTEDTDRKLRNGLDKLLAVAGEALDREGKVLVPNLSESRLRPGRWTAHARFGGAMEEIFALRQASGVLTFQGAQWRELRAQASLGEHWLLLMTHGTDDTAQRVGYATAALLAGPRTCWSMSSTRDYTSTDWSRYQDLDLGTPVAAAVQTLPGVWSRTFTAGWVAVNSTGSPVTLSAPAGMSTLDGDPTATLRLDAADAAVLTRIL